MRQERLQFDELLYLLEEIFIPLGFCKFRLTGGEPLLYPKLVELVERIANFPKTQDLSLTTNGFLLESLATDLFAAGLRRINISLDSLNPKTFDKIIGNVGPSRWLQTWRGIQRAYDVGFEPLKLNVVVIPGINDHEIEELVKLTIDRYWHVRFIEFMPIGNTHLFEQRAWIPSEELRDRIRQRWGLVEAAILGHGPADIFQIPEAKGTIGFISQMSDCFCDRCNRVRLSADGWLRPCLLNEMGQLDLRTALRAGRTAEELRQQVQEVLALKPEINFKERNRFSY